MNKTTYKKGRIPWNKGKTLSDEHRKKLSNSHKGKKYPKEKYPNMGMRGKTHTEEWKKKQSERMKGKNHPNYKGQTNHRGYLRLFKPNHPQANKKGYIAEQIIIMEKYIGRYLKKEEIVHHINSIRDDNRIENLKLFKNHKEHMKYHKENCKYLWGTH